MAYEIITPVVTIFDDEEKIDYEGNKKVIDFLVDGGVDGILVLGSTGEFTGMTYEEKRDFFRFYMDYTAGRTKLYVGTGSMNFDQVVDLTNEVEDMGYDGVFVIGQYYYGTDQTKLFDYYDRLAKSTSAKINIYNFPDRSGHSLDPETIKELVDANENIVGLKDSIMAPLHTNLTLKLVDNNKFSAYSGFDDQFLYNLAAGGRGCIGALSNLVPEIWSDLVKAANNGDFEKTMLYHSYIDRLMPLYNLDANFSYLFKILMKKRGLDINTRAIFPYNKIEQEKVDYAWNLLKEVIENYKKN